MATVLEIANQALLRVGAETIIAFPDTTSERGRAVSASWSFVREATLRAHSWNCATTRAFLASYAPIPLFDYAKKYDLPADCLRVLEIEGQESWRVEGRLLLTDGVIGTQELSPNWAFNLAPTAADPVVCSSAATPSVLTEGEIINITGSSMTEINDRNFKAVNISGDTFELEGEDGTGRTTGAEGHFNCVEVGDLGVRYIRNLDTDAELAEADSELTHAFVVRLAAEIASRVPGSNATRESLLAEFDRMIEEAIMDDGEEQSGSDFVEDDWITVRY